MRKRETLSQWLATMQDTMVEYGRQGGVWALLTTLVALGLLYLPTPPWSLTVFLMVVIAIVGVWVFAQWSRRVVFYPTRRASPDIIKEMGKAKEVWLSWHTGAITGMSDYLLERHDGIALGAKISQAMLIAPDEGDSQYLPIHARCFPPADTSDILSDIRTTIQIFKNAGVQEIKTFNGPLAHLTFFHYEKPKNARVRIETWGPYLAQNRRPVFYVEKKKFPDLYDSLERSFCDTWRNANT